MWTLTDFDTKKTIFDPVVVDGKYRWTNVMFDHTGCLTFCTLTPPKTKSILSEIVPPKTEPFDLDCFYAEANPNMAEPGGNNSGWTRLRLIDGKETPFGTRDIASRTSEDNVQLTKNGIKLLFLATPSKQHYSGVRVTLISLEIPCKFFDAMDKNPSIQTNRKCCTPTITTCS